MANSKIVNTPSQAIAQAGTTHTQRTISGTAVALVNWTLNANTTHVFVQFTGATARITLDGTTNPTTSLGFQYPDGSTAYWTRALAQSAKAIRDDSTDVVCEIQELNFL
jgi:hypothetical protein